MPQQHVSPCYQQQTYQNSCHQSECFIQHYFYQQMIILILISPLFTQIKYIHLADLNSKQLYEVSYQMTVKSFASYSFSHTQNIQIEQKNSIFNCKTYYQGFGNKYQENNTKLILVRQKFQKAENYLKPLKGKCAYHNTDAFKYQVCFNQKIRQYDTYINKFLKNNKQYQNIILGIKFNKQQKVYLLNDIIKYQLNKEISTNVIQQSQQLRQIAIRNLQQHFINELILKNQEVEIMLQPNILIKKNNKLYRPNKSFQNISKKVNYLESSIVRTFYIHFFQNKFMVWLEYGQLNLPIITLNISKNLQIHSKNCKYKIFQNKYKYVNINQRPNDNLIVEDEFISGDYCQIIKKNRNVTVIYMCGQYDMFIKNVTQTSICNYKIFVETIYLCSNNSQLKLSEMQSEQQTYCLKKIY